MLKVFVSLPNSGPNINTFFPDDVRRYLEERFEVEYLDSQHRLEREAFADAVKAFDVVMTGWGHIPIDRAMLCGTRVKLIAHTGGSVGSLVSPDVFEAGVRVISGNLLYAESVAEGVIAYMLTGLRRIPTYIDRVKNGGWIGEGDDSQGLLDRSVGIIGMGTISRLLIEKLGVFNAKIFAYSSHEIDREFCQKYHVTQVSLQEALACDIVTLHSAMNEKTRGMIGKKEFSLIRDGALFINTARGRIVDEAAMVCELKKNRFRAVLDVYYDEPLPPEHELRRLENVYCLPHMAGPTIDRRGLVTKRLADNIMLFEENAAMPLEITKEAAKRMTVGG